jgi:chorismate mutase
MNELERIRAEIDTIDREIIDALARRMLCVEQVAEIKEDEGVPTHVPDREEDVRRKWMDESDRHGLDPRFTQAVLDTILEMSKKHQEEMR